MSCEMTLLFLEMKVDAMSGRQPSGTVFKKLARYGAWSGCLLTLAACQGCGPSNASMVKVSGRVTFDGGGPPAVGSVSFQPIEPAAGFSRRPGRAIFDKDGYYEATSIREGDGLTPGKYKVVVSCNSGQPDPRSPTPWEDITYIALDYEPQTITVEQDDEDIELNIDLPLKKP